jgi:shikimate dehydrogenase
VQTLDGLGVLVYQGAIGFKLRAGLNASVKVMYDALARAFGLT